MPRLISLLIILSLVCFSLGLPAGAFAGEQTISLTKTADLENAGVGNEINYTYYITNNSTDNITGLSLADDQLGAISLPAGTTLLAGDNMTATATYTVQESDFDGSATAIVNNVILSGIMSPSGDNATATASESVALIRATGSLSLTKEANVTGAALGDNITYTYNIANNYTENVTGLVLSDDKLGTITLPATMLAAGDNMTATKAYTVVDTDFAGSATAIVNTANVTGHLAFSLEPVKATATLSVDLEEAPAEGDATASISVNKEANRKAALLNDVITYTYTVSNNGTAEITGLTLNDDKLGDIPLVSGDTTVTSLQAGENITATATYIVAWKDVRRGIITNVATAAGVADGKSVSDSDEVIVSTRIVDALLSKAQILLSRGVPGKGIEKAPGLQKPFNPNSQAAEHAGKKDVQGNLEQNSNRDKNKNLPNNREQHQEQELNGNTEQEMDINSANGKDGQWEINGNAEKNKKKKKNNDN